jgi:hypothetical protein
MRHWGLVVFLMLACAACGSNDPTGPQIDARGNTGTIITNITGGSSSPVGTAPCGASSAQKGNGQNVAPDCPVIITPVVVAP